MYLAILDDPRSQVKTLITYLKEKEENGKLITRKNIFYLKVLLLVKNMISYCNKIISIYLVCRLSNS